MRRVLLAVPLTMLVSGCTVVNVSPVGSADRPTNPVCIERNPKVVAADFLPVVEDEFRRHGIQTAVYDPPVPARCEYVLEYTARQSWDMVSFLRYAELRLRDREKTIGTATYRHRGGLGLNKWASTRSKMRPVIDQLLSAKPPAVDALGSAGTATSRGTNDGSRGGEDDGGAGRN